jgi:chromate transport protein ChrA
VSVRGCINECIEFSLHSRSIYNRDSLFSDWNELIHSYVCLVAAAPHALLCCGLLHSSLSSSCLIERRTHTLLNTILSISPQNVLNLSSRSDQPRHRIQLDALGYSSIYACELFFTTRSCLLTMRVILNMSSRQKSNTKMALIGSMVLHI